MMLIAMIVLDPDASFLLLGTSGDGDDPLDARPVPGSEGLSLDRVIELDLLLARVGVELGLAPDGLLRVAYIEPTAPGRHLVWEIFGVIYQMNRRSGSLACQSRKSYYPKSQIKEQINCS